MRAAVLMGLYGLGLVAAIGTAALLKGTLLKGRPQPFVMELPPYRMPSLRSIGTRLQDRTKVFLRRAGKIILTTACDPVGACASACGTRRRAARDRRQRSGPGGAGD